MRVILEVIDGSGAGKAVSLEPNQACRVGRSDAADLVIADDGLLSRMHFVLECGEASCRLRDLNSTNGTYVNGAKVTEAEVGSGDLVVAGTTSFSVRAVMDEVTRPLSEHPAPSEAAAAGQNVGKATALAMKPYNPPEPKKEE